MAQAASTSSRYKQQVQVASRGVTAMQLGMVGLGRMGANIVRRLLRAGHECVVFDLNPANVQELAAEGATGAASLDEVVQRLRPPRAAWVMVPAGPPTEQTVLALAKRMAAGDILIDGGNSYYKDDVRRARLLKERSIDYVDVGTSGGVWGLERGYCLMIGGDPSVVTRLGPIFEALAPGQGDLAPVLGRDGCAGTAAQGYLHCGPAGAGHFVKMIHNGIEYGLMQAYAEGFDILRQANAGEMPEQFRYDLDVADIAELWRRGSVVGSWLLDLTASALAENPDLTEYTGFVQDSGEGRWTIMAAVEEAVPADVLSAALYTRFRSRHEHTFAEKLLSAMRHKFGGHVERPAGG
ncbi:MAG: decarboxylating 6-phosphogluconate dehydrogenase [Chloroflexi bacterium]|nr:decarboxylating 6-phosphogluconate dehydrogenase [Chloroflexota bacterium]